MQPNQNRNFLSKKDIVIIAVILAAAAAFYFVSSALSTQSGLAEADVYYDTKLVKTVLLKPGLNDKFAVPGQPNVTLEINNGRIRFYESTCRDKICIHAGYLSHPGETAACLPNRVAVKIVDAGGGASGRPDTYIN